jgi:glycosyltransferase involved in cell wall biosynthesis
VLVVAYNFPPHAAIGTMRTLRVVRRLHDEGWRVSVLTGSPPNYLPGTPVDPALLEAVPRGVHVVRAPALRAWDRLYRTLVRQHRTLAADAGSPHPTTLTGADVPPWRRPSGAMARLAALKDVLDAALSIPDREVGWLLPASISGIADQLRSGLPDVVYSSAPPWTGHLVAAVVSRLLRRPWVADFRDPWARAPWREDRRRFAARAAARLERSVVRLADRVVFVTQANRDDFAAQYGPSAAVRFHVVPNGCDPAEFEGTDRELPADGRFVLLHAGSLYAGRTPLPIFQAVAAAVSRGLIDPARFTLRFLGTNGLQSMDAPAACRELGIDHLVEFLPRVQRREGLRQMRSASALLLLQPGHAVSTPGKLYEYLAAGRPILAIAEEGETADLVRRSGFGVSVAPGDQDAIVRALASTMRMAREEVPSAPRELFDGTVGAARIAAVLESLVRRGRSARLAPVDARGGDGLA